MEKRGLGRGLAALIPENRQPLPETLAQDEGSVRELPVAQVEANPFQPRTLFDPEKMADLVASVREHGVLQPVLVRRVGPERYQLVAGERRFRAAQKAGLAAIPAVVRDCTDQEQLEMAVVENLQREDIGAMEAARAYRRLIDEFKMTQDTVAQRVGKSRSAVANVLRLLRLPEEVQDSLERGEISEGHARALMMAEFSPAILHAWQTALKKQLSVRDTEKLAKTSRESMVVTDAPKLDSRKSTETRPDPNEAYIVTRLQEAMGTRVQLRRTSGGAGKIEIEFYSEEELQRLMELLVHEDEVR